jgi:hypothetical protein
MVSKLLTEKRDDNRWRDCLPGLGLAILVHSFFNHFFLQPMLSTILVLLCLPLLVVIVFHRSEQALEEWLGTGFDADAELLRLIHSGEFSDSKVGLYLHSLKRSFPGEVVADMLCYLRLYVELSLRAKGELMMRESGFRTSIEPELEERFAELRFLEGSIGRTGKLVMLPLLRKNRRDPWLRHLLRG